MTRSSDDGEPELNETAQLVLGLIVLAMIGVLIVGWFRLSPETREAAGDVPRRVLWIVQRIGDIVLEILGAIWDSSALDAAEPRSRSGLRASPPT